MEAALGSAVLEARRGGTVEWKEDGGHTLPSPSRPNTSTLCPSPPTCLDLESLRCLPKSGTPGQCSEPPLPLPPGLGYFSCVRAFVWRRFSLVVKTKRCPKGSKSLPSKSIAVKVTGDKAVWSPWKTLGRVHVQGRWGS